MAWLVLSLTGGCAENYDHSVAVLECDGTKIEAIERYRKAGFSGHTGLSRFVLVVSAGSWWRGRKEIDITHVDGADLSPMESAQPEVDRWRRLAPHGKASRRVFVSPGEFSAEEFAAISSCLERHIEQINRAFATPRPPVQYFEGDGFRERWAGLRSIVYKDGVWKGNPCMEANTSGFRFACAGDPFFFSVDAQGYVRFCVPSEPTGSCGRAVGRVLTDGHGAFVRSPDPRPLCAQGAFVEWLRSDWKRFYRECRLPSGHSLENLFEIRESEILE